LIGERHLASRTRLGGLRVDVRADRSAHDDLPTYEVNVTPAQRDELPAAQTGVRGDANQIDDTEAE
jgi:hypothetical protein